MVPLSVLDLSPIVRGGDAAAALRNTIDLARHAEAWGYRRYWLAEHHNMPGIASAATSISSSFVRRSNVHFGSESVIPGRVEMSAYRPTAVIYFLRGPFRPASGG